ncbi:hypothetical protein [Roseovarius nitratireducens]|uniref:hypothetical protein n=1 Tax=Roseovarius nitratireducens TaxID=2044597 RepID=UPI000CE1A51C|nr:hypothetical protein [Roseovarius nitratireducens]
MPGRLLAILALLPWLATAVLGGAWPRAEGEGFLAASGTVEGPDEFGLYSQSFSLFAEYGATERLTLGVDLGGDAGRMSKAIAFLRWPLGRSERQLRVALEVGAGQVDQEAALRPAFSVGRGISIGEHHGWLNADTRAILFDGGTTAYETDLTAGLSLGARVKGIVQLQAGAPARGRDYLRLAPSVVYEARPGTQIELGLTEPLTGGGERGFKIGLWRTF